jgi:hypothetical protein
MAQVGDGDGGITSGSSSAASGFPLASSDTSSCPDYDGRMSNMCRKSGSGEHILEEPQSRYALCSLADPSQSYGDMKLHSNLSISLVGLVMLSTLECSDAKTQGLSGASLRSCATDEI